MSEAEFKEIVTTYQDRVYNTCLGFLKNEGDAEDMAQEVFITVFNSYDTFLGKSALSTWLHKIAMNKCLEEIRKRNSQKRSDDDTYSGISENTFYHPGVTLENKERSSILLGAIAQLPEAQQTAFTLSKIDGLSYEEIAKVMNKTMGSVESLIHRGKGKLQQLLKDYYEGN
ncbi:MAG: RNA polymerase sigma factor [Cyclobacteriaceae bacterium]